MKLFKLVDEECVQHYVGTDRSEVVSEFIRFNEIDDDRHIYCIQVARKGWDRSVTTEQTVVDIDERMLLSELYFRMKSAGFEAPFCLTHEEKEK